jgi:2-methylisocitrate lyase-like PEP mutase family enzyme
MTHKTTIFRDLHQAGNPFVLANAWDAGSAKMLAALGAKAIATSSAAHAFTLGLPDLGNVTRDQALTHAQDLVAAGDVPVSGDFEDGFGKDPDTVAETVRLSAEVGLAGICIEDTDLPGSAPLDFDHSVERIRAACAAAKALGTDFVVCARADGMMHGTYGMDEALRRLLAYEAAGADCLYAPCPPDLAALSQICSAVKTPVNALSVGGLANASLSDFASAGAARVSLGSRLARVTHAAIRDLMREILQDGNFAGLAKAASAADIDAFLEPKNG